MDTPLQPRMNCAKLNCRHNENGKCTNRRSRELTSAMMANTLRPLQTFNTLHFLHLFYTINMRVPGNIFLLALLFQSTTGLVTPTRQHAIANPTASVVPKTRLSSDAAVTAELPRGGGESGGTATIPNEVFNLIKSIVGAGVLSLPAGEFTFGTLSCQWLPIGVSDRLSLVNHQVSLPLAMRLQLSFRLQF